MQECILCGTELIDLLDADGDPIEEVRCCPTHANMLGQGYIAFIGTQNEVRTGDLALVKRDKAEDLGLDIPEHMNLVFCPQETIVELMALAAQIEQDTHFNTVH